MSKLLPLTTTTLLCLCLCLHMSHGQINIDEEINRLQSQAHHLRPPPEILENVLDQIQAHCTKTSSRRIDNDVLKKTSLCIEQYTNETQLVDDIKKAVPEGQLDTVFKDMCLKWPKIRSCLDDFFGIIEDCWPQGKKVTKIVHESVKFFCGEDNDGGKIALFLAEGGLQCLQQEGDNVKKCLEKVNDFDENEIPTEFDPDKFNSVDSERICRNMNDLAQCTMKELKRCKDTTPENLITSMLKFSSKQIECVVVDERVNAKAVSSGGGSILESVFMVTLFTVAIVFGG